MTKLLPFLSLFLFLYTPQIRLSGGAVLKTYFIVVIGYALLELARYGISRKYMPFILFSLLSLFYSLLLQLATGYYDLFVTSQIAGGVLIFLASSFIVRMYSKRYVDYIDRIMFDLALAIGIHSAIILATVFNESFREILYSFIYVTEKADRYLFGEVHTNRYPGLTVSGFSFLSMLHTQIALVIVLYGVYCSRRLSGYRSLITASVLMLSVFSLIFVARTGLYLSLLIMLVFFVYVSLKKMWHGEFGFIFVFALVCSLMVRAFPALEIDEYIEFAFELFINLESGEGFSSSSTDQLVENEFFLPGDPISLLLGTGNFGRGESYIYSDIGWVLFMFGGGFLGILILYAPLFYILISGFIYRFPRFIGWYLAVGVILLLVANFKDIYYLSHGYIQTIMLLFILGLRIRSSGVQGDSFCLRDLPSKH